MAVPPTDKDIIDVGTRKIRKAPAPPPTQKARTRPKVKKGTTRKAPAPYIPRDYYGVVVGKTGSGELVWGLFKGLRFSLKTLPDHKPIKETEVAFKQKFEGRNLQQIRAMIKQKFERRNTGEI